MTQPDFKTCKKCGKLKAFNDFANSGKNKNTGVTYRRSECRECWYETTLERHLEKMKDAQFALEYREKSRTYQKNRYNPLVQRTYLYKVTTEEQEALLVAQDYKCAICDKDIKDRHCLDHNHQTGKIREFLCVSCNRGIGYLADDVETLRKAWKYLERHL